MSDYASKLVNGILEHIREQSERKTDHLVNNRLMPDNDVHWHRGYVSRGEELITFITKELPTKLDKG